MKSMKRLLLVGLVYFAAGCSDKAESEAELPAVDCATETVPTYMEVSLFKTTCVSCHASTKTGDARKGLGAEAATVGIDFDTYAAAKTSAMSAAEELYEGDRGAMPPEDSKLPAATAAEKRQVLVWAKCGTPE
jgi:mono/diheme cytochrome c family protein